MTFMLDENFPKAAAELLEGMGLLYLTREIVDFGLSVVLIWRAFAANKSPHPNPNSAVAASGSVS